MPDRSSYAFTRRAFIGMGAALLGSLALLLLWFGFRLFLVVFAGVLVGVFLNGLTHALCRRTPLSYNWAFGVVILVLLVVTSGLGWLIGAQVASQLDTLAEQLPEALDALTAGLREYTWGQWILARAPSPQAMLDSTGQDSGGASDSQLARMFSMTMATLTHLLVLLLVGFYLALHRRLYARGLLHLIPQQHRSHARDVLHRLVHALRWWFVGRFASMAVVGALTALGLTLLGVPLALTLGLLAALFSFVPYLGPIISFIPAILMGFLQSPQTALYVLGLMLLIQFLESYAITPLIQKRAVSIPPALLITAELLMGTAAGVLGMLIATPLAVVVIVLIQTLYVEDALGDKTVGVLGE